MGKLDETIKTLDEAVPKVALFFYHDGKVLQASTPVRDADDIAGWKNHEESCGLLGHLSDYKP